MVFRPNQDDTIKLSNAQLIIMNNIELYECELLNINCLLIGYKDLDPIIWHLNYESLDFLLPMGLLNKNKAADSNSP